jgi:3-aminobutyryl-CoA ammonia-lyase
VSNKRLLDTPYNKFILLLSQERGNGMSNTREFTATIRVRMSASDAHYGGYLVNGAHMLALFGDVATELAILCDGDEGLLVGYENVEFLAPLFAGDFVEAIGRITRIGRTSRRMEFEARKVITARRDISDSAADVLDPPIIVGRAVGTTVVKAEQQRKDRTL